MATSEVGRLAAQQVSEALEAFRVVAIVGPRQSGKTTLARTFQSRVRHAVSLDDLGTLAAAKGDPAGFIRGLPTPVIIDEFQRAPDILLAIKSVVDDRREPGMYLLTGSAEPSAVGQVRETLAGRLAMVVLGGLSWSEIHGNPRWSPLPDLIRTRSSREVLEAFRETATSTPLDDLIDAGGFPEPVVHLLPRQRAMWNEQYIRTYLERDVPQFVRLDDVQPFLRFVRCVAGSTGTILNLANLARDVGISHNSADRWRSVLESTFLLQTVTPYWRNARKRLAKAPKIHFADTALAMSLSGVGSLADARRLNLAGALVETWVFQMFRAFGNASVEPLSIHTFRTVDQVECDLVLESRHGLVPIEIKSGMTVTPDDARGVSTFLDLFGKDAEVGIVLHSGTAAFPLTERIAALPMSAVLRGPSLTSSLSQ